MKDFARISSFPSHDVQRHDTIQGRFSTNLLGRRSKRRVDNRDFTQYLNDYNLKQELLEKKLLP